MKARSRRMAPRAEGSRSASWRRRFADRVAPVGLFEVTIGLALVVGVLVRAYYTFSATFPLGDGGLFYQMTRDLQAAHYHLPSTTSYNSASLPYAYPPLGFYLAGLLDQFTPLSLFDVFRFLPLAASCLALVAMFVLARDLMRSGVAVVVSVFVFALVPEDFTWLLMGGGLTRALGLLFALLALDQMYRMYTRREWRYVASSSLLAALTILSHLETGLFLAFSGALFFFFWGLHRRGVRDSAVVSLATIALTAPWWASVVTAHGIAPFLAANATGGGVAGAPTLWSILLAPVVRLLVTSLVMFPLLIAPVLFGVTECVRTRRYLLPAWWVAVALITGRAVFTLTAVPVSMLAGVGATQMLSWVAVRPLRAEWAHAQMLGVSAATAIRTWAVVMLALVLWYATSAALGHTSEALALVALSPGEREALTWVSQFTPQASRFLIVSPDPWQEDAVSEWFPVLAQRVSVDTVQGYEWLPAGVFAQRISNHEEVERCADEDSSCVRRWPTTTGLPYDYVLVPKAPPKAPHEQWGARLVPSMQTDPHFRLVYDDAGATIYALNE